MTLLRACVSRDPELFPLFQLTPMGCVLLEKRKQRDNIIERQNFFSTLKKTFPFGSIVPIQKQQLHQIYSMSQKKSFQSFLSLLTVSSPQFGNDLYAIILDHVLKIIKTFTFQLAIFFYWNKNFQVVVIIIFKKNYNLFLNSPKYHICWPES